ncbi:hypothetical protein SDC9_153842 [bioreactor metagenome]|uniref:Uncharacterized protein n=1 Tax=bioreactor metagenome TaxID=1076179 RepID=A0A645EYS8_9ZZZZ
MLVTYAYVPFGLTATPPVSAPKSSVDVVFVSSLTIVKVPLVSTAGDMMSGNVRFSSGIVTASSGTVTLSPDTTTSSCGIISTGVSVTSSTGVSVTSSTGVSVTSSTGVSVTSSTGVSVTTSVSLASGSAGNNVSPFCALTNALVIDIKKIVAMKRLNILCVLSDFCFPICYTLQILLNLTQFDLFLYAFIRCIK